MPTITYQDFFRFGIRVRNWVQYRISSFDIRTVIAYPTTPYPIITITTTTLWNESTWLPCHHKMAPRTNYNIIQASSNEDVMNLFLRVRDKNNTCIRVTQENSIENSVQDSLSYIWIPNGPCELNLAYPKWPCISHILWYHSSRTFYVLLCILWLVTITNPNLMF